MPKHRSKLPMSSKLKEVWLSLHWRHIPENMLQSSNWKLSTQCLWKTRTHAQRYSIYSWFIRYTLQYTFLLHVVNMVFTCKFCGKEFPTNQRHLEHLMIHQKIRVSCPREECERTYSNYANLRRHDRDYHQLKDMAKDLRRKQDEMVDLAVKLQQQHQEKKERERRK